MGAVVAKKKVNRLILFPGPPQYLVLGKMLPTFHLHPHTKFQPHTQASIWQTGLGMRLPTFQLHPHTQASIWQTGLGMRLPTFQPHTQVFFLVWQ